MSKGIDLDFVRETYQRMSDEELIRKATTDTFGLTPEAIEIVQAEIKRRGLNQNINKGIEAQNREYTLAEIDALCDIISKLNCPTCGSSTHRLNATKTGEVVSAIFFSNYETFIKVGCPSCLDKANNKALIKSAVFGWWSLPGGPLKAIHSIGLNLQSKCSNHTNQHTEHFRTYALSKIGELETWKDDREQLQRILDARHTL